MHCAVPAKKYRQRKQSLLLSHRPIVLSIWLTIVLLDFHAVILTSVHLNVTHEIISHEVLEVLEAISLPRGTSRWYFCCLVLALVSSFLPRASPCLRGNCLMYSDHWKLWVNVALNTLRIRVFPGNGLCWLRQVIPWEQRENVQTSQTTLNVLYA